MTEAVVSVRERVEAKRVELDRLRASMRPGGLDGLDAAQRIDVTYTSNALEGNTLTAGETALVLEKGITIAGKPLRDHLEAVDHAKALDWVRELASDAGQPITEAVIRNLHRLIVAQSVPKIAGRYADRARFVNTAEGPYRFPSPIEIGPLMGDFDGWLVKAAPVPLTAFEAHLRLVAIHPFNDGNGRTARLLMNLLLMRGGYPAIAIRPEERAAYTGALERSQSEGDHEPFRTLLFDRLDATLDVYLTAARQAGGGA